MKKPNYEIFIDFDNTITRFDVLDDILERFSKDTNWIKLENEWKRGHIGSRTCLEGQLKSVRVTKRALDKYLTTIKLDPYFKKFVKFLGSKNLKPVILSDNFVYILKRILAANEISNLTAYANKLKLSHDKLIPHFPFKSKHCRDCAHCKKRNINALADKASTIVYIGDGFSDICASKRADIVFAKQNLLKYVRKHNIPHIPINSLKDVYEYFKTRL